MDATARIKNLSIALEALSRIACTDGRYNHFERVQELLAEELREARQEQVERKYPLKPAPARPAIPIPNDDIPF